MFAIFTKFLTRPTMSLLIDDEDIKQQPIRTNTMHDKNEEFPLIKQLSCKIKNKSFEFVIQYFTDKVFIIITQKGRIGQMISASTNKNHVTGKTQYNISTILGLVDDFSIINLLSRQLIEQISKTSNRTLLLGVAFDRNLSNDFLPLILKCIDQIKLW